MSGGGGGMNIIIPLGGLGSRFQNEGYSRPKPFVRVLGKEMIRWVVDKLKLGPDDALVIVFNPKFMSMDVFMRELVQNHYKNCTLVELKGPTRRSSALGGSGAAREFDNGFAYIRLIRHV